MQRRDLLLGAAGGIGAPLIATGCAPLLSGADALASFDDVEARWQSVLATRDAFGARGAPLPLDGVFSRGRSKGRVFQGDDLSRKAARTLLLSGAFRDLPEDARAHPSVQRSMFGAMGEFDESILGMKERLAAFTPTERADLSRAFREDPELAERVMSLLDDEASRAGASDTRRLHLRKLGTEVCARLHQSSDALVDEYVDKLDKVYARAGSEAELERKVALMMGEEAFASLRTRTLAAVERWQVAGAQRIKTSHAPEKGRGTGAFIAGGVFLGLAAISGIVIAISAGLGGIGGGVVAAFVGTAGGVFLLVGLICVIVGAAL